MSTVYEFVHFTQCFTEGKMFFASHFDPNPGGWVSENRIQVGYVNIEEVGFDNTPQCLWYCHEHSICGLSKLWNPYRPNQTVYFCIELSSLQLISLHGKYTTTTTTTAKKFTTETRTHVQKPQKKTVGFFFTNTSGRFTRL